jgi:hypothetical protein
MIEVVNVAMLPVPEADTIPIDDVCKAELVTLNRVFATFSNTVNDPLNSVRAVITIVTESPDESP